MLEVVFHVVLEIVCGMTGHVVLWAVTLGRWKVFQERDDLATLVGLLFWALVVGVIVVFFVLR